MSRRKEPEPDLRPLMIIDQSGCVVGCYESEPESGALVVIDQCGIVRRFGRGEPSAETHKQRVPYELPEPNPRTCIRCGTPNPTNFCDDCYKPLSPIEPAPVIAEHKPKRHHPTPARPPGYPPSPPALPPGSTPTRIRGPRTV